MQIWNYSFGQKFTHTLIMDMAVVVIAEVLQYLMLTKLRHINLVSVTDYKNKIAWRYSLDWTILRTTVNIWKKSR